VYAPPEKPSVIWMVGGPVDTTVQPPKLVVVPDFVIEQLERVEPVKDISEGKTMLICPF